jgi:hypothetical protein
MNSFYQRKYSFYLHEIMIESRKRMPVGTIIVREVKAGTEWHLTAALAG